MASFMNRAEFIARRDAHNRRHPLLVFLGVGIGFIPLALSVILLPGWLRDVPGYVQIAGLVVMVAPLFAGIGVGTWLAGRVSGVRCPGCSKMISLGTFGYMVVATGNCPHCGKKLLSEDDRP